MSKCLVAYYSFSKITESVAFEIAEQINCDIREIVPEKPYSFDYNTAAKEARSHITKGYCPPLLHGAEAIDEYDTIFIGTPNWFKSLAPPVLSFLRIHDFSNKRVIPFCSHGGGGFGEIENVIYRECPDSTVLSGMAVNDQSTQQITNWLKSIGVLV